MTTEPSAPDGDNAAIRDGSLLWLWLACVAAAAALLAFAWGNAPVRIKAVGISSVGLGCLFGWLAGRLARDWRVDSCLLVSLVAFCGAAGGLAGSAFVAYRAGVAEMEAYARAHPPPIDPIKERFEQALAEPATDLSPEERRNLEEVRAVHERGERLRREHERKRRVHLTFYGYLRNRIPTITGEWEYPWPVVLWILELVVSAVAAGSIAGFSSTKNSSLSS